jgi:hypothetical protein
MFIDRSENEANSVRRSGIQVELHHSGTIPLLRTEPKGDSARRAINITPLNGVNHSMLFDDQDRIQRVLIITVHCEDGVR